MKDLALLALDRAVQLGASYADARLEESAERHISTKNGKPGQVVFAETCGLGVRVIAAGAWGFARRYPTRARRRMARPPQRTVTPASTAAAIAGGRNWNFSTPPAARVT